jgi:hypothetical protein
MPTNGKFVDALPDDKNVEGILAALRYLSREAEGAGLRELAKALEEAELKCGRCTAAAQPDCQA